MNMIYLYDDNGFYVSEEEPLLDEVKSIVLGEDIFFSKENSTFIEPPEDKELTVRRFVDGVWMYVNDFRGLPIYKDSECIICDYVGDLVDDFELEPSQDYEDYQEYLLMKAARDKYINDLTITVDGMEFKANDLSQNRMVRAILSASLTGSEFIPEWKLSNGFVAIDLKVDILKSVLVAAVAATSSLVTNEC